MDNELVKKLISKNQKDFDFAASQIINNCDVQAFEDLVGKSDFLFDFIKDNVSKRLANAINKDNFRNLFKFLNIYSADYENVIVSSFVKYADEDITDEILVLLEDGCDSQKAYAAKYFYYINDSLCLDLLIKNCFCEFEPLACNCAETLGVFKEKTSLEKAYQMISSKDEFEVILAVKFLAAYRAENSLKQIFEAMKKSSLCENIAAEIPYIEKFTSLLDSDIYAEDAIFAINSIIQGFGDIIPLSQVFDFELFQIFERFSQEKNSKSAITLLNAKQKFNQLTENDEYLFDEDKNTKQEIKEISLFLNSLMQNFWDDMKALIKNELSENSVFIYLALQIVQDYSLEEYSQILKELVKSTNQTVVLKAVEVMKSLGKLNEIDAQQIISSISDRNIKNIIESLF